MIAPARYESPSGHSERAGGYPAARRWAKVIDHSRCIGCHACTTACKSENVVPIGVTRTYVKYVDVGQYPLARRSFQVTRCNQCESPPCAAACPTGAMHQRPDGIVDFDKRICIGCKACIAACPYDAIFINPDDHCAEKCNFCAHRIAVGLEPACVVVCPTQAIVVGSLDDETSRVAVVVQRDAVSVRRPEKDTRPRLFYKGAHQVTLDPLAARRPPGGLYMWSEQPSGAHSVGAGHPADANASAPGVVAYDVDHRVPWDWRVSAYTWTKSVAAGSYLIALLLVLLRVIAPENALWMWAAPLVAGVFMAGTGALLIWDLERPERFPLVLLRPQWRSWLARGGVIISGFSAVLAFHVLAAALENTDVAMTLAWAGGPLAVLTAVYTAYLLAQARGRDLWQSALLPPQLVAQAAIAGAAVLLIPAVRLAPDAVPVLLLMLAAAVVAQIVFVVSEISVAHVTAQARLAAHEMTRGRFARWFTVAAVLAVIAVFAPWMGPIAAAPALVALAAYEHAYIQAAQLPPLA